MFACGPRGHSAICLYFVLFLVFFLGRGTVVFGRPQVYPDNVVPAPEADGQPHGDHASLPADQQSSLTFLQELFLKGPVNPDSENVGFVPPVSPYQPYPPSNPPVFNDNDVDDDISSNNYNSNQNHQRNLIDNDDDLDSAPSFSGDGPPKEFVWQGLDGSGDAWGPSPGVVVVENRPSTDQQQQQQQKWLDTPRITLNQRHESNVQDPSVTGVDLSEDTHVQIGLFPEEGAGERKVIPELWLNAQDPESSATAAGGSGGYASFPNFQVNTVSSPAAEVTLGGDVKDVRPMSSSHPVLPDVIPDHPREVVAWPEMLQRDIIVDRPISYDAPPSPPSSFLTETQEPSVHPTEDDSELQQWKTQALGHLDRMDGDRFPLEDDDDDDDDEEDVAVRDIDVDAEDARNPFQEEEEEEDEDVPEELVRQVIEAMNAPAILRLQALAGSEIPYNDEYDSDDYNDADDGDEEEEEIWITITDDDYGGEDWVLTDGEPGPALQGGSRLITLIFESIATLDEMLDEDEREAGEGDTTNADELQKELSIWQVLTNFPFPMLLGHSDQFNGSVDVEYTYDDGDDDDYDYYYYDDDYYDDDYYDDDYYDDDENEDFEEDDDDEEGDYDEDEDEEDYESDELDDYFYSEPKIVTKMAF